MATLPTAPSFDVQGHRGCRGLMPENTVPAFKRALDENVTTLEMDVVISRDRQVVVSHDPYMNADFSTDPAGNPVDKKSQKELVLFQMDYTDIKRYDVGVRGNSAFPEQQKLSTYKPLLTEVIAAAEAYQKERNRPPVSYNIELKSEPSEYNKSQPEPALFCDLVQAILRDQLPAGRITIQSFDFAILQQWKKQIDAGKYPTVRLSALVSNLRGPEKNLDELGFKPDIYSPYHKLMTRKQLDYLHEQHIQVIPWTVNQRSDMERLKRWGVDGLITDYPDRAKDL
ncbi:glycerophosphodiester phosphodiesterase family protein [Spirosoma sp. KUDC1026]|uniref:glycerophosphodiester phosphodiesterase family protein n=1 Tax=Spirosoma sp. KUDC1026 TaxID=2745947 RepID=UPI00159BCC69|nr:glycerophosphodiester phosphodiesterase family protein [Spirosoma sp. KUDC1026]QKZ11492.1 glycerophosphodiester phosphodiesterase [Spirosoma sp. KUDC1026]